MKTNGHLAKFFAVTETSLYVAHIYGAQIGGAPFLEKRALRSGAHSRGRLGIIARAPMLAICKRLVLFTPEGGSTTIERELVHVNTGYWGVNTSLIIALFLTEQSAKKCLTAKQITPSDPRWKKETVAVIRAIGKDHPFCSISRVFVEDHDFNPLLLPKEWEF